MRSQSSYNLASSMLHGLREMREIDSSMSARSRRIDPRSADLDEKSRSQPADPPENGTCRAAEGRGGGGRGGQLSLRERAGNDEISFIRRRWSRLARRIANGNAPRNVRVSKARRINRRINRRILAGKGKR